MTRRYKCHLHYLTFYLDLSDYTKLLLDFQINFKWFQRVIKYLLDKEENLVLNPFCSILGRIGFNIFLKNLSNFHVKIWILLVLKIFVFEQYMSMSITASSSLLSVSWSWSQTLVITIITIEQVFAIYHVIKYLGPACVRWSGLVW